MTTTPTDPAKTIVLAFMEMRDLCEHYSGFKESHDESQCSNSDHHERAGNWCSMRECPRLRAEARQQGVD